MSADPVVLEIKLAELDTDHPLSRVEITVEELQDCPHNRPASFCRPAKPRRLHATTDATGVARFTLPATKGQPPSDPPRPNFFVRRFSVRGYVGNYPTDSLPPGLSRHRELERQTPLGASGFQSTYWLVPASLLKTPQAVDAEEVASRETKLATWLAKHDRAHIDSTKQVGLQWFVQWKDATEKNVTENARCVVVDALDGAAIMLGTVDCVLPP